MFPSDLPQWLLGEAVPLESQVTLHTANGPTTVGERMHMQCPGLVTHIDALLLDGTPPVAPIGIRVEDEQHDVHWIHGYNPYFVKPDGDVVWLDVEQRVPWIRNDPDASAAGRPASRIGYCNPSAESQCPVLVSTPAPAGGGKASSSADALVEHEGPISRGNPSSAAIADD